MTLRRTMILVTSLGLACSVAMPAEATDDGLADEKTVFVEKAATGSPRSEIRLDLSDAPKDLNDGIEISPLAEARFDRSMYEPLVKEVSEGKYGRIDSMLLMVDGKLVSEHYYTTSGAQDLPHYQMSVTKSMVALAYGRAIQLGIIGKPNEPIIDYLPQVDRTKIAEGADQITFRNALSMRSGLRYPPVTADQKGELDPEDYAQELLSKTESVVETREVVFQYAGTNPDLVLQALAAQVDEPLMDWIDRELLKPLGIKYTWKTNSLGVPGGGAGMSIRSRDMVKMGLMLRDKGVWNGRQLIPTDFLKELATPVIVGKEPPNTYGYFWWQHKVDHEGVSYHVDSARGAGGQFIFWVPKLDLLYVVTSTNSGGARRKPFEFLSQLVIPARVKGDL